MKKAFTNKKTNHVTFMYIPENQSEIRSVRIPLWVPKALIASIAGLFILSFTSFAVMSSMKLQYNKSKADINKLTNINQIQKSEIEILKANSLEIQKQLEENDKVLNELKKAVGLKNDTSSKSSDSTTAAIQTSAKYSASKTDMSSEISEIKQSLTLLSQTAIEQAEEIDNSKKGIKNRVSYLSSKPSIKPINATITCSYGYRNNPFTSRGSEFHKGIDFGAPYGSKAVATADGTVIFSGWQSGYGKVVIVSHGNGYTTTYAHNSKLLVKQGDKVKKGQAICKVGSTGRSTGAHLHYEIRLNGKILNPAKFF